MFTFKKDERLCSHIKIEQLFATGKSFLLYPYRIIWLTDVDTAFHSQLLISVSKRNFRRAVKRNLLKRRIRESFRKNKQPLYDFLVKNNLKLIFAIVYIAKEPIAYTQMEYKMIAMVNRLTIEIMNILPVESDSLPVE